MIPLMMIVCDEFRDRAAEMALADWNHPIEALLFDRSHEALLVGIRIGRLIRRLRHPDSCLASRARTEALHFVSRSQISTRC